jgi:hypothetical protein
VPDIAAFADKSPGYPIICSPGVQGCGPSAGQTIAYVGGTSAAAPLVAGMTCCTAGAGFDLASGLGSPLADQIAAQIRP